MTQLTADIAALHQAFSYCPDTGEFRHKIASGRATVGKVAGGRDRLNGYVQLQSGGKRCLAHRVAWAMTYGEYPPHGVYIDHINGDRADNRICNLRLATSSQNQFNSRPERASKSGRKGVVFERHRTRIKRWRAIIKIDGKRHHLGLFETLDEAIQARDAAERIFHGSFKYGVS